jgi:structural maintenance of chromosome 1
MFGSVRSAFEEEQLKTTRDRLAQLDDIVSAEEGTLVKLEEQKHAIQNEISESEDAISALQEELGGLQETLDEKSKTVEQVKRTTSKASKVLDQALKEIATKVSCSSWF